MSIDPREFGRMEGEVEELRRLIDEQGRKLERQNVKIDALLELANKSKGGLWVGMTLASLLGGLVTYITDNIFGK